MRGTCWLCVLVCARGLQPPPTPVARPRLRPLGASSTELEFGSLRISAYEGRLAVQWGVRFARETAPPAPAGALEVRDAPGRGRGVFAAAPLPEGAFLGTYGGDVLDAEAFAARYGAKATPELLRNRVLCVPAGHCSFFGDVPELAHKYKQYLLGCGFLAR